MIRVLSQDHDFYFGERRERERVEDVIRRRVDLLCLVLVLYGLIQFSVIRLLNSPLIGANQSFAIAAIFPPCSIDTSVEKLFRKFHG